MISELIGEFKGKTTGMRVLSDGKVETSESGAGVVLKKEASGTDTGVGALIPNGVIMLEGNGMITTAEGDAVMVKINGIGWATGKGLKSSYRGACYFMTNSSKLSSLNKTVGVLEHESDEKGDYSLKCWAWK